MLLCGILCLCSVYSSVAKKYVMFFVMFFVMFIQTFKCFYILQMLDGEMYEKIRDFFVILSRNEVDCCGHTQERFMKILTDATLVSISRCRSFIYRFS